MDTAVRNDDLIREVLRYACDRSEVLILATPYMRFETSFLRLDESVFHCHANMSHEDAKYGLRSPDLKIRFPHGHHFYEAATKLIGLGRAKGRQSLQLAIPASLEDGESRRAYRVERVGRVPVTFSTRKYNLLVGNLVNISTTGVRIFLDRSYEDGAILVEDVLHIAFTLPDSISINTKVAVRYMNERTFGAEFEPPLAGDLLDKLSKWAFQRREENALALARALTQPDPLPLHGAAREAASGRELILVSGSSDLGDRLTALLAGELPPLRRIPPTVQAMRDLGPAMRALTLFHVDSPAWVTKKRTKALIECLPPGLPYVLVGTGLDPGLLSELGTELGAVWSYALPESPGNIFLRLLQGILRIHFPAHEDPPDSQQP